jgi:CRISPR/Cas system-associated protein Cas5 (RAMP superfamily)
MFKFDSSQLTALIKQATEKLGEAAGESALRAAGVAGADVFREEAKRNLIANGSVDTGTILRNIIMKRREEDSDGNKRQSYIVTVRKGKFNVEGDAFYARFVEDGHKFVRRNTKISKKTGKKIGWKAHRAASEREYGTASAAAKPFMRPAFSSSQDEAIGAMKSALSAAIKKNLGG